MIKYGSIFILLFSLSQYSYAHSTTCVGKMSSAQWSGADSGIGPTETTISIKAILKGEAINYMYNVSPPDEEKIMDIQLPEYNAEIMRLKVFKSYNNNGLEMESFSANLLIRNKDKKILSKEKANCISERTLVP